MYNEVSVVNVIESCVVLFWNETLRTAFSSNEGSGQTPRVLVLTRVLATYKVTKHMKTQTDI